MGEEEDCAFDPLVVVRTSSEGRMLSKWLDAARKRLGGTFPRDAARDEMEAYAEKMRRRKLKGGKQAVAGVVEDEMTEAARLEKRVVRLSQVRLAASFLRGAFATPSPRRRTPWCASTPSPRCHTPSPRHFTPSPRPLTLLQSRRRRPRSRGGGSARRRIRSKRGFESGERSSGTTARSAWARCPRRTSGSTARICASRAGRYLPEATPCGPIN